MIAADSLLGCILGHDDSTVESVLEGMASLETQTWVGGGSEGAWIFGSASNSASGLPQLLELVLAGFCNA